MYLFFKDMFSLCRLAILVLGRQRQWVWSQPDLYRELHQRLCLKKKSACIIDYSVIECYYPTNSKGHSKEIPGDLNLKLSQCSYEPNLLTHKSALFQLFMTFYSNWMLFVWSYKIHLGLWQDPAVSMCAVCSLAGHSLAVWQGSHILTDGPGWGCPVGSIREPEVVPVTSQCLERGSIPQHD